MEFDKFIDRKSIVITGGSGTVGRILANELLNYSPKKVIILSNNENELFQMRLEYKGSSNFHFIFCDILDFQKLNFLFSDVDIVLHLAALKHVVGCEIDPLEAVKTNIIGIQNIIHAAIEKKVSRVLFTSSDKAVNPSNIMGTTKLLSEKIISQANEFIYNEKTIFSSVRFGNILGSSGSVLPLFLDQISAGQKLTITHEEMNRYILTEKEVVDLVFNSLSFCQGSEIFVPKMRAIRIIDLARAVLRYHSKDENCLETIGIYSGEKLYEELFSEYESQNIYSIQELFYYQKDESLVIPGSKKLENIILRSDKDSFLSNSKLDDLVKKYIKQ